MKVKLTKDGKVSQRGAHLKKPDSEKVGKKEYVPTGKPRGRPPKDAKDWSTPDDTKTNGN